jgi:hypothetical protein
LPCLAFPSKLSACLIQYRNREGRIQLSSFLIFISSSNTNSMASSSQPAAQPDLSLISELLETIERSPPGIGARKLLVEHYMSCGWLDAARDGVSELLSIDRNDGEAQLLRKMLSQEEKAAPAPAKLPSKNTPRKYAVPDAEIKDINEGRSQLSKGYKTLFSKAKVLHWEMNILLSLFQQRHTIDRSSVEFESTFENNNSAVEALAEGRLGASQKVASKPDAARTVAREMEQNPTRALDIAIQDLTDMAEWLRSAKKQSQAAGEIDNDAIREALVKRSKALTSALPRQLQPVAATARCTLSTKSYCVRTSAAKPCTAIQCRKSHEKDSG